MNGLAGFIEGWRGWLKRWWSKPAQAPKKPAPPVAYAVGPDSGIAAHESGHAIVAWASPYVSSVRRVTIVPDEKDESGGHVCYSYVGRKLDGIVASSICALAGLAGELIATGKMRTGNGSRDILTAVELLKKAMEKYGDGPVLQCLPTPMLNPDFGRWVQADESVIRGVNAAFTAARLVIHENRTRFARLQLQLIRERTLNHRQIGVVLGSRPWAFLAHL